MSLTFETILDRTTELGPNSQRNTAGQHSARQDAKQQHPDESESLADAYIGVDDATRRIRQAMRNTNEGITLLQVAEGSLQEIARLFAEMRGLVQQAATPLRDRERAFFQAKLDRLTDRINQIAENAQFEEVYILNGSTGQVVIEIEGESVKERIEWSLPDLRTTALGIDPGNIDVGTAPSSRLALPIIDTALQPLDEHRASISMIQDQLEQILHRLETLLDESTHMGPRIRGAELAIRTAAVMKEYISHEKKDAIAGQIESLHGDAKHLVS
jgi:flagellin